MNYLQRYLVDEFVEDYQEGLLSRRQALQRIAGITGVALATQLLAACGQPTSTQPVGEPTAPGATADGDPTAASAPSTTSVLADDAEISAAMTQIPGDGGQVLAYLARPTAEGAYPIVLVCHENRGLTPHIEDVARRIAKAGYVGVAVDLLWREGGTAQVADADGIPGLLSGAPPERHVQDFQTALEYVKGQPFAQADRVGMVGFCFGGGVTWLVAAGVPELRAAVPFYGPPVPTGEVPKINAAVLAIYAERDSRINQTIPEIEAAMQQNSKTYRKSIYPGVDHAFHNDTGQRYSAEAAQAAWGEALAWFEQYLKA
ncbi:MAG: dienelactone hydrolase family protein [Roseiflexaceae bacterium]|nr:dienelactone hydrolase family protein [Roseiflexaceae bacterium]